MTLQKYTLCVVIGVPLLLLSMMQAESTRHSAGIVADIARANSITTSNQVSDTSADSIIATKDPKDDVADNTPIDTVETVPHNIGKSILRRSLTTRLPMIALAIPYSQGNRYVRDVRNTYIPTFRYKYDDYLQFTPFVAQWGMYAFGIRGYSQSVEQMLLSDAIASAIMMGVVYGIKETTSVRRPDSSTSNSFPSGHTAMAFTAATLLSLEYGDRYPIVSLGGYAIAAGVGISRILNNRHWIGDVMVGATIGIVSGELGYWLSDIIYKRPQRQIKPQLYVPDTDIRLTLPWSRGMSKASGFDDVGIGLGVRWAYDSKGYFLFADAHLEGRRFDKNTEEESFIRSYVSRWGWGRKFAISKKLLSADVAVGVGIGSRECFPLIRVSPRIRFNERLSWKVDASYEWRTKAQTVYRSDIGSFPYTAPNFRLGATFEVRI